MRAAYVFTLLAILLVTFAGSLRQMLVFGPASLLAFS